ncbi:hypothetical protein LB504_012056 [Fusarium proliferatum]|nr:hypothetical protein LB504_012056 [Fusarium proliferatum]
MALELEHYPADPDMLAQVKAYIDKFVGAKITWHKHYNTKAFTNMHRMKWISTVPGCETTIKDT